MIPVLWVFCVTHTSVSLPAARLVSENTRPEIIPVLLDLGDVEVENHKCLVFAHKWVSALKEL